jgi:hypothetical protein
MKKTNELSKEYHRIKYNIGSGSFDWFNIKSDFEIQDEMLMSQVFQKEKGELDINKASEFQKSMEAFKEKINSYLPLNEEENQEKVLLLQKVDIGLEIYKLVLEG